MPEKKQINCIMDNLLELEELLKVIRSQDINTPAILYKLAQEKAEQIAVDISFLKTHEEESDVISVTPVVESRNEFTESVSIPVSEESEVLETTILDISEPTTVVAEIEQKNIPVSSAPLDTKIDSSESVSMDEVLQRRMAKDIRNIISLNDRFRFRRELFFNDDEKMSATIQYLNETDSYKDAFEYLQNQYDWDLENETVSDFMIIVEKRFL